MSRSSKYSLSDVSEHKGPKGFMFVTTGQTTEKVAQNIGKDKFDKASDNYLELGCEDLDFKAISLDVLQSLTEVDRNTHLEKSSLS